MLIEQKILSVVISLFLAVIILVLIKRGKLREEYALLWLLISIIVFLLAAFSPFLYFIMHFFKASAATSVVFMLGIIFLLLMNLHFSVSLSGLKNKIKQLVQDLALLETELKREKDKREQGLR